MAEHQFNRSGISPLYLQPPDPYFFPSTPRALPATSSAISLGTCMLRLYCITFHPPICRSSTPEPRQVPAYQRRKDLRAERHRLISELARKRRWQHREANQWVNGKVGIRRVEDATIEQLQTSCDRLVEELIRLSRARAGG